MLWRRAGEVDTDLVAVDLDRRVDPQLAFDRLDDVLGLPPAVGHPGDRSADHPFRVSVELVHRRRHALCPTPRAQLFESSLGKAVRGDLRAQVAAALVGIARVRDEQLHDLVGEEQRRDDQSLLIELAGERGQARRLHSADIRVMRARDGIPEHRSRHERDVRKVRAAGERVVEDARLPRLEAERHRRRDGVGHRAEVDGDVLGLRDHASRLVEHRRRAVAALLDVRRERRADEHGPHLLRDSAERAAEHLQLDVHRVSTSVPSAFVSPCQPSGTQQVAPDSSSVRGPSTL